MYIEKQYFQNPLMVGLKWLSIGILIAQLGLFVASESGTVRLPFGPYRHLIVLFSFGLWLILWHKMGVQLLITEGGYKCAIGVIPISNAPH